MNTTANNMRPNPLSKILLVATGLILTVCIVSILITKNRQTAVRASANRIEKIIAKFDEDADSFYNGIISSEDTNINAYLESMPEEYFTTLFYTNYNISYWSNNNSNYPWHISPILSSSPIYETNNSFVYSKIYNIDTTDYLVLLLPISNIYNVENKYLHNGFTDIYKVSSNLFPNFKFNNDDENIVRTSDGKPLFSIKKTDSGIEFTSLFSNIIFILTAVYFAILISFCLFHKTSFSNKRTFLFLEIILLTAVRFVFYFISNVIFKNQNLFSNEYFNEGICIDSCGNLLITASYAMVFAFFILLYCFKFKHEIKNKFQRVVAFVSIGALAGIACISIYNGIKNSNLAIHFFDLSNIDSRSVTISFSMFILMITTVLLCISISLMLNHEKTIRLMPKYQLPIIIIVSIIITIIFNLANDSRETQMAYRLSQRNIFTRNDLIENDLHEKIEQLKHDSTTYNIDINNLLDNGESQQFNETLEATFSEKRWQNFHIKYVIADTTSSFTVNNDTLSINSNEYFRSLIDSEGTLIYDNIWFINDIVGIPYLLSLIKTDNYNLWLSLASKYNLEGSGYPELLSTDESYNFQINVLQTSIAIYQNNELIRNIGSFTYPIYYDNNLFNVNVQYTKSNHYKHFTFYNSEGNTIVISRPYKISNLYLFPLSILLIGFSLVLVVIHFVLYSNRQITNNTLNNKFQVYVITVIIATFTLIGILSIYLIVKMNNEKNLRAIQEKTYSLCKDINMITNNLDTCSQEIVTAIIKDLSYTNFLDINIYDEDGYLYCTSNEEMFNNNLTSNLINPVAKASLRKNNRFICEETIGKYRFMSSYIVFVDKHSHLYVINVPYFVKQTELKKEISDYITSFINVFLIIVILTMIIAYLITSKITLPLEKLQDSLANLNLQENENIKLDFNSNDEIGALVEVYNKKVDELRKSAELLAKSERESAWREMARQVAHEIKNPLTPMKLSTQFIYKMWKENNENFDTQFEKYKSSMIAEIDNLSDIATAFSSFAKMPVENKKELNLSTLIKQIFDFYSQSGVNISYNYDKDNIMIYGDSNLMSRVFHNIIRNAIQAYQGTEHADDGNLEIKIISNCLPNNNISIRIIDNGPGVSEENKEKIFAPNFTTKSSGAGLGLAIVKNIIENMNGTISLVDRQEPGAEFEIVLPVILPSVS